jgi:hypothetical protein
MKARGPMTYPEAVAWLAMNDDHDPKTVEDVAGLVTTALVADIFRKSPAAVAKAILWIRTQEGL